MSLVLVTGPNDWHRLAPQDGGTIWHCLVQMAPLGLVALLFHYVFGRDCPADADLDLIAFPDWNAPALGLLLAKQLAAV